MEISNWLDINTLRQKYFPGRSGWANGFEAGHLAPPDPMADEQSFTKADFGPQFYWGVASAAFQTEGSHEADGKAPSIWDTFTHHSRNVKNGHDARVATDFYRRFPEDLAFVSQMNLREFRFSLAWPRVLPTGTGRPNPAGLAFYDRLVDHCLAQGVTPWLTLYHWDLPQALEDRGGWTHRDVVSWFTDFADLCTRHFGDRVKNWMVLNEPMSFTGLGYYYGLHAPGRKGLGNFLPAVHHAVLAQAEGGRVVRANVPGAQVGTTFSCSHVTPHRDTAADRQAAARMDALVNRLFIEPALGLGYPAGFPFFTRQLERYIRPGDLERAAFDFDFIGVQNYFRLVAQSTWLPPFVKEVPAVDRGVEVNEMGFEVHPEGMYHVIKQFAAYQGVKKIIVTENGVCYPDQLEGNTVHDHRRIAFFKNYLGQLLRAKREGAPVEGYFVWSLTDNFEWAEGYHPRFGLVYVDYATQQRYLKDSGRWFGDFLA
ncbi:MAG: GH1 family beta-glucosidase [Bernardetiaceae bacterium]|nr:GH1 family beta-glucosidase [Bernardetiaceae bacterium]